MHLIGGVLWGIFTSNGWAGEVPSAFYEGFEGPEVSWQQVGSDTPHRVEFHGRSQGQAHVGQGSEQIRLVAGHGSYVYFAHPIGRAPVLDELLISLWVKSDRAGIQVLALVVLPRTLQPQTGRPLTTLIQGTTYTQVGRWEQLRVQHLPQQLARQVRILRSQYGPQVDEREAYVSHVVLNVYGGPGITNLWIDDLDVVGLIDPKGVPIGGGPGSHLDWAERTGASEGTASGGANWPILAGLGSPRPVANSAGSIPPSLEEPPCALNGSILQVQGRAFFPRIIQYRGESLSVLAQLGFNTIWLERVPSPELLKEADRLNLWFISPPPISPESSPAQEATLGGIREKIPQAFDRVLAWDVTLEPLRGRLADMARWAERVRRADIHPKRPLVARATENLLLVSRWVDIVWLSQAPIGSSLGLEDYTAWLRQRELLVRPGTPLWATIPTQLPGPIRTQWLLVASGRQGAANPRMPENLGPEQIRLALYAALAGGVRAVAYESDRPLDAQEPETQTRAATLELLNRETEVLEPWLAAGGLVGPLQTSLGQVQGALLRTERARLAILFWTVPAAQSLVGQAAAQQVTFLLPGLPDAHEAYQIAAGRLQPLPRERTAGGTRIQLEEFDLTSLVLLTQDPIAVSVTSQRAQAYQRRLAQLHHQLAAEKLRHIEELLGRLPAWLLAPEPSPPKGASPTELFQQAQQQLTICAQRLQSRDYAAAVWAAQRANRAVRLVEQRIWQSATGMAQPTLIWPLAGCFRMLPEHLEMVRRVRYATAGPNLLPAGDFEDLSAMVASGWQRGQNHSELANGFVELSHQAARSGGFGLRLLAVARQSLSPPEALDISPIWVLSPSIPVQPGQWIRIQGWVQIPRTIQGSVDGLIIADSVGGESLAWRIRKTVGWQPFEMYRIVPQGGTIQLKFVLTGLGEVLLDDVVVQPMQWAGPGTTDEH